MSRPLPYTAVISAAILAIDRYQPPHCCSGATAKEIVAWIDEYQALFASTLTDHWKAAVRRCLVQSECFKLDEANSSWQLNRGKLNTCARMVVRKLEHHWQRHPHASMQASLKDAIVDARTDTVLALELCTKSLC
jgi:hypothetical protein